MGGIDYLRLDKTKDKAYAFDHAFDAAVEQRAIFEGTALRIVPDVLRGCNACCFAYGATGAGKTFTMMGNLDQAGVIPLTLIDLFENIAADDEQVREGGAPRAGGTPLARPHAQAARCATGKGTAHRARWAGVARICIECASTTSF